MVVSDDWCERCTRMRSFVNLKATSGIEWACLKGVSVINLEYIREDGNYISCALVACLGAL